MGPPLGKRVVKTKQQQDQESHRNPGMPDETKIETKLSESRTGNIAVETQQQETREGPGIFGV